MSIPGIPMPMTPQRRPVAAVSLGRRVDFGLWLARAAALLAFVIAVYLAYASIAAGGQVAGCGDSTEAGCGHVLTSRWAKWLGIPVGVPAVLVYLSAVVATWLVAAAPASTARRTGWTMLAASAALIGGAAIWFVGLQLLALSNLCWYCLALHTCGLILVGFVAWRLPQEIVSQGMSPRAAMIGAGTGALGVAALIAGQLLVAPAKAGMKVTQLEPANPAQAAPVAKVESAVEQEEPQPEDEKKSSRVPSHPWSHRRLSAIGGSASLDIYDFPVIGDREADRPVLEIFDYTCPHCRELFRMLEKVHPEYGDRLTLVLLPIPMNKRCNKFVTIDQAKHATACELTKLAIAVWQTKPEAFEEFHAWMMRDEHPPTPEQAEAEAARRVGVEPLRKALADSAVEEQMHENCRIYALARDGSRDGAIPKLIYDRAVTSGLPASEDKLREFLESDVGLIKAK